MNVGEVAGETMEFIMSKIDEKKQGKEFVDDCLDILSLCMSELIKAGYCDCCYNHAIERVDKQLKEDLEL